MTSVGEFVAEYRIDECLGEDPTDDGVDRFTATDPSGRRVTIRQLRRRCSDEAFARFTREIQALAAVYVPTVVPLLDAGICDKQLFAVTPRYPLGSLGDRSVSVPIAAAVIADCADGAHALHQAGIIHRNIQPQSLYRDGEHGRLGDLGLSRLLGPGLASTGIGPIGSFDFVDPDVVAGHEPSPQNDVWALAVTLHLVATGASVWGPQRDYTLTGRLHHVISGRPQLDPSLSPALRSLLAAAFGLDQPRLSTAAEFASVLRASIDSELQQSTPGGMP